MTGRLQNSRVPQNVGDGAGDIRSVAPTTLPLTSLALGEKEHGTDGKNHLIPNRRRVEFPASTVWVVAEE